MRAASRCATIIPAAWSAVAGSVTVRTRGTNRASSSAAVAGSEPMTMPVTSAPLPSASARASVATSVLSFVSEPSPATSPWTQMPAIR